MKATRLKQTLIRTALAVLSAACCSAGDALPSAAPGPARGFVGVDTAKFGAGIIVGEPTGATLKYWLNDTFALDGAAGWSFRQDSTLYLHGDVLWHTFDLIPATHGRLPVYLGVGSLVRFRDDHRDNEFGVRFPIGVSYFFEKCPIEVFMEVGPAIDFAPATRSDFTGGIGIRYRF